MQSFDFAESPAMNPCLRIAQVWQLDWIVSSFLYSRTVSDANEIGGDLTIVTMPMV